MCEQDYAFGELLSRVRGEYLEMPGLHQAGRLWGLDAVVTDAPLSSLVASGFLRRTRRTPAHPGEAAAWRARQAMKPSPLMSQGSGMMSGTHSCGGAMNFGQFTLSR